MHSLRSIDVMSCAKIMGAIYGSLALVFLPFFLLAGFGSLLAGNKSGAYSGIAIMCLAILAPVIYGIMGFVMGAFSAWVYNFFARRIGGIRLELRSDVPSPSLGGGTF
jgi:hypothetical protein